MQRSAYIVGIKGRVRDTDQVLLDDDYSRALDTALRQLTHDRPVWVDGVVTAYVVTEVAADDNVPLLYLDAVMDHAAGLLLTELAAHYAGDSDSTINADSVDRQTKEQRYARMARVYSGRYYDRVGVSKSHNAHASATANLTSKRPRNLTFTDWLEA